MLSKKAIKYFKENWYTFEQINDIEEWLKQDENGEVLTEKEMQEFIKTDLFSKRFSLNFISL